MQAKFDFEVANLAPSSPISKFANDVGFGRCRRCELIALGNSGPMAVAMGWGGLGLVKERRKTKKVAIEVVMLKDKIATTALQNSRVTVSTKLLKPRLLQIHNFVKKSSTGPRKMLKSEFSDSESQENDSSGEESEKETPRSEEKTSDYELQRLKRIEENKKRMEALGLHRIANSFIGSVQKDHKKKCERKGKRKMVDEDEEYKPSEIEEETCSSSEEDGSDDDKFSGSQKGKAKKKTSTPKKQVPNSDILDDDAALMQAIALSLKDSAGFLDVPTSVPSHYLPMQAIALSLKDSAGFLDVPTSVPSLSPGAHAVDKISSHKERNSNSQDDVEKRKRKKMGKPINSRVQMTLDEMVIHFFHFDEVGKGNITLRDIQRVATAHDFTWSEKEISDMIYCFDSDGDGKLNLDDFRKIVGRCNMIKDSDNGARREA
ncbi:uncharacterized protein LOC111389621 [Olea europaea var. sylvestris]|uniref:uncharacterized protein LOC111389621 n=1 Tax=Olea europaea var. sylvestris TaxID=158386 RepID=UPI000C1D8A91|nr:uncharacterized protein LOC111389621 [Olea europaea var. sylvestris]